jgi:hypothetical protein
MQPEAAQRALSFYARHHVVGQLHVLLRSAQHELARVDDEGLVVAISTPSVTLRGGSAEVDRRDLVALRRRGRSAEAQVDARRLQHRRVPGVDADAPRLDEAADRPVGEHRRRRHGAHPASPGLG